MLWVINRILALYIVGSLMIIGMFGVVGVFIFVVIFQWLLGAMHVAMDTALVLAAIPPVVILIWPLLWVLHKIVASYFEKTHGS